VVKRVNALKDASGKKLAAQRLGHATRWLSTGVLKRVLRDAVKWPVAQLELAFAVVHVANFAIMAAPPAPDLVQLAIRLAERVPPGTIAQSGMPSALRLLSARSPETWDAAAGALVEILSRKSPAPGPAPFWTRFVLELVKRAPTPEHAAAMLGQAEKRKALPHPHALCADPEARAALTGDAPGWLAAMAKLLDKVESPTEAETALYCAVDLGTDALEAARALCLPARIAACGVRFLSHHRLASDFCEALLDLQHATPPDDDRESCAIQTFAARWLAEAAAGFGPDDDDAASLIVDALDLAVLYKAPGISADLLCALLITWTPHPRPCAGVCNAMSIVAPAMLRARHLDVLVQHPPPLPLAHPSFGDLYVDALVNFASARALGLEELGLADAATRPDVQRLAAACLSPRSSCTTIAAYFGRCPAPLVPQCEALLVDALSRSADQPKLMEIFIFLLGGFAHNPATRRAVLVALALDYGRSLEVERAAARFFAGGGPPIRLAGEFFLWRAETHLLKQAMLEVVLENPPPPSWGPGGAESVREICTSTGLHCVVDLDELAAQAALGTTVLPGADPQHLRLLWKAAVQSVF
jgi:hypothetical protein